ncbi:MAG: hypothetical protein E6I58_04880 [Chloroflexi bacterium]|nr:MAG: hypothetical protein E6I58_04880 [Chloroflexota bacterium]
MPEESRNMVGRLAGALAFAALAAACGGSSGLTSSQPAPSPVILADTSPGRFQVSVFVSMGGYDRTSRDSATLDINVTAGGHPIRFTRNEGVTCNGTALTRFVGAFEGTFPLDGISGKAMTCEYVSGTKSASVTLAMPRKLRILTPREGEAVSRGARTDITYDADPSGAPPWGVVAISADAKASALPMNTTSTHSALDTSTFTPGPGSIALTQQVILRGILAPAFRPVTGMANLMTSIQVVWR